MDLRKHEVVMMIHNISADKWDTCAQKVLEWYLKEFWNDIPCGEDLPLFILFLNLIYPDPAQLGWLRRLRWQFMLKRRITRAMTGIGKTTTHRCLMFEELRDITEQDVYGWMNTYCNKLSEKEKEKMIREMFKGKIQACMADIEDYLDSVIQRIKRRESGLHTDALESI